MDKTKEQPLKEETSTGTIENVLKHKGLTNKTKVAPYRSRTRISKDLLLSRLGTFFVAVLAAIALLFTKRYDMDRIFGFGGEMHWTGPAHFDATGEHSLPGHPNNEYAICTRNQGGIYTVDEGMDKDRTQCIVVGTVGTITGTGSIDSIKGTHPHIRPRFLPKRSIVVPGLVDSHAHIMDYGWSRALNLDGTSSVEEVVRRVREYVLKKQADGALIDDTTWIEGVGWDQNRWSGWKGGFPTYEDLEADPILRGKSIILFRVDIHAVWVSKRVLELCGKLPKKVDGGEIIVDADGNPTGVFLDNAQLLIPRPACLGLTAIHDAMTTEPVIDLYKKIADEGTLPIRLHMMAHRPTGYLGDEVQRFSHYGKHQRLHLRSVKLVADGAIGSWGAAMYEPYSDNPSTSGFLVMSQETLRKEIPQYLEGGWQVNVHCIGDRANGIVLDVFEDALNGKDVHALRPRIEHAQIFRAGDIERLGRLGLIASVQPTHATSDMVYADARLGSRTRTSYAYRSLIDNGARIALGSDAPVESADPLVTFHAAVTRVNATGGSPQGPGGWHPEQKITRKEALKGMTLDAAYASFSEDEVGNLVVGKKADFVVLDQDIMRIDPNLILKTKVLATVVDGVVQYGSL